MKSRFRVDQHCWQGKVLLALLLSLFLNSTPALGSSAIREILPLEGCAWLESDGVRAAWLSYKQIDDSMLASLQAARVNTVFLKHGFHDLLDMKTARFEGNVLLVEPRDQVLERCIESTVRASKMGIHVFWLANYELEQMLPHLERLGYQPAYAEGPGRYLRSGPQLDASPLDSVFWRGITGAHGELVAKHSREIAIDGLLYDTEHYAGGMMYLQNCGFSDPVFDEFIRTRIIAKPVDSVPRGQRYSFLKNSGRLEDYYHYLEEAVWEQGRELAQRWHAINPNLVLGVWPLLDNWFSQGLLRGMSGAVPVLGLSGVEYYHGSGQSAAMASYFQNANPNLIYLPGFYPPYAYSIEQLKQHVTKAIRETGHYWMLGPHEELGQGAYQTALREVYESVRSTLATEEAELKLSYKVRHEIAGPVLVVTASGHGTRNPLLSLFSSIGGAPLCEDIVMSSAGAGTWQARIPLMRRITNNEFMADGFRSGGVYSVTPPALDYRYEDRHHTKLIDGAGYGYFGTTIAWHESIHAAQVGFDFHRDYRVVRVEMAQPRKLEDRHGGPTKLTIRTRPQDGEWSVAQTIRAHFEISEKGSDMVSPIPSSGIDPRHNRAWLSWRVDVTGSRARWVRIEMEREHENSSISLGEVVVWAAFDGEIEARLRVGNSDVGVREGRRWKIPESGNGE